METLPCNHTVEQGEHISSLAERYGFMSFETIWGHPENADLRALRGDPNLLLPGDVVVIPERRPKTVTRPTGRQHTFVVKRSPLELRVRLLDFLSRPLESTNVVLEIGEASLALATDGEGSVVTRIARSASSAVISVGPLEIPLRIGALDPITEDSGVFARLVNLGYLLDPSPEPDADELELALEELQADHGLDVTGVLDDATRAALLEAYGC